MTGQHRSTIRCVLALCLLAGLQAMSGASAQAAAVEPGFYRFDAQPSTTLAGGHPNVVLTTYVNTETYECKGDCLNFRSFKYHWPTGFIGNPHVAPKCSLTEFNEGACPVESQIGSVSTMFSDTEGFLIPLFNMETRPDQAGQLGFLLPFLGSPSLLNLSSRTDGDYGLDAETSPILRGLGLDKVITELWGVPADPVNDPRRFAEPLTALGTCYIGILGPEIIGCPPGLPFQSTTYEKSNSPEAPFLTNPTTCGVPLTMSGEVEYYGGAVGRGSSPYPATTGCSQASFNPSLTGHPTTLQTDSASGLDTNLRVPQTQSPQTPSPSELRSAVVTLPEGFSINPNAVDGKVACPTALSSIGTLFAAACPEFAKVGSLMLDVTALPAPIPGALYLAEPRPGEPYRVLLAANGFATHVKLLGRADLDARTGQVRIVFEDLPQSPLQEFSIHVFGSERGLFATPAHCGNYSLETEFVPWNSQLTTRTSTSTFTIASGPGGEPCPGPVRPFQPSINAGSVSNAAGAWSPFSFAIRRSDGEQVLTGVDVSLPPGFTARLAGVSYCPEAAIERIGSPTYDGAAELAEPSCPAASRIGDAVTGVGAGNHPLYVPGKVFLAGPYKGAPLSMVVSVPAVAGPYDLGTVAVRVALYLDPSTAEVTAKSDPLPQILGGVPIRIRSVLVNLNRPEFARNPTNCDQFSVDAELAGDENGVARAGVGYQAANCSDLPFAPKLGLKLSGGLNRRGHPAIHADLVTAPGEANMRMVSVTLPKGELLDNSHIGTVCTRPAFAANKCPESALVGKATVVTPLLDRPLAGKVYLRASRHELPDLALDLEGQIDVEAVGMVDSVGGSLRTTFEGIPDVPVSSIAFDLAGGAKGLLQNTKSLCAGVKKAKVRMIGQNDTVNATTVKLRVACKGNARSERKKRHGTHSSRKAAG